MDTIIRKAIEHAYKDYPIAVDENSRYWQAVGLIKAAAYLLENTSERKKATWRKIAWEIDTFYCSSCGGIFTKNKGTWNFCPNCGADMRKRSKNETN